MKLCIIGGSTAGWWTAGYFEKLLPDWDITIFSSPDIPGLGVGESTLPQLKWWWEELGIEEKDEGNEKENAKQTKIKKMEKGNETQNKKRLKTKI